jgi:hypothetical protein
MSLEKDIAFLSSYSQFANLLRSVKESREAYIRALHQADTNTIQQISGRILAIDEMLDLCNAEQVILRHKDAPVAQ